MVALVGLPEPRLAFMLNCLTTLIPQTLTLVSEDYPELTVRCAFYFGRLTYRIIKDTRFMEEDHYHAYLSAVVAHPSASPFAVAATSLPPLPVDVVPARFPASRRVGL